MNSLIINKDYKATLNCIEFNNVQSYSVKEEACGYIYVTLNFYGFIKYIKEKCFISSSSFNHEKGCVSNNEDIEIFEVVEAITDYCNGNPVSKITFKCKYLNINVTSRMFKDN